MKILVLSLFLSSAIASPLVGDKPCTWGPVYWCSHFKHATQCGAFKHCMDTVWTKQILKVQTSEECTICEFFVDKVLKTLSENSTEAEIANEVSKLCTELPTADARDQCKGIVEEYMPQIIQLIKNEVSSQMICSLFGLCTERYDAEPQAPPTASPPATNTTCSDCKAFMKDLKGMVVSVSTVSQIEQILEQGICDKLGPFKSACYELVKVYTPQALAILAAQVDPDIICRVLGFCEQKDAKEALRILLTPLIQNKPRTNEDCQACKSIVTDIDDMLRDQSVQTEVKSVITDDLCPLLGSLEAQCKQYVSEYAQFVFELLVSELDPDTVCKFIGECTNETAALTHVTHKAVTLGGVACDICKPVVTYLEAALESATVKTEIMKYMDLFCSRLPDAQIQAQCKNFVETYGTLVLNMITKYLNPDTLCTDIGFCSARFEKMINALRTDPSPACQLCHFGVEALAGYIKGLNMTTDQIVQQLGNLCNEIPATYRNVCTSYLNKYKALIEIGINMLLSSPDSLCSLAQICPAVDPVMQKNLVLPIVPIPEQALKNSSVECQYCKTALEEVSQLLKDFNMTANQIVDELDQLCQLLPGNLSQECKVYLDQYGPLVINLLLDNPDEICQLAGLCTATASVSSQRLPFLMPSHILPLAPSYPVLPQNTDTVLPIVPIPEGDRTVGSSAECILCEFVMNELKTLLNKNATEQEIMNALDEVCGLLPATVSTECTNFVNKYTKGIILLLEQEVTADMVCTTLGLCSSYERTRIHTQVKSIGADVECILCEFVMKELDSILAKNATKAEIMDALNKVCGLFPSTISSECKDFVKQYGPAVIALLEQELSPQEICTQLGLCTGSGTKLTKKPEKPVDAGPFCVICEFVMKEVDSRLAQNASQQQIRKVLDEVCSYLPSTISDECTSFVNTYYEQIIQILLMRVSPQAVCTALKLCATRTITTLPQKPVGVSASVECVICEFAIRELNQTLKKNASKRDIENAIEKLCSNFPAHLKDECDTFVEEYGPAVIDLLDQQLDPKTVCTKLGLCTGKTGKMEQVKASPGCVLCEFIMSEVKKRLAQNATEADIRELIDKVCSYLPGSVSGYCQTFVDTYAEQIIKLLLSSVTPTQICTELDLCSSRSIPVRVMGQPLKERLSPVVCEACEEVLKQIQDFLDKNSTKDEIAAYFDQFCDLLPDMGDLQAECKKFVKDYTITIVGFLEFEVTPKEICAELKLCNASKLNHGKVPSPVKTGTVKCTLCTYLGKLIKQELDNNHTQDDIKLILYKACSIVEAATDECKAFVDQYLPQVINIIETDVDPETACVDLGMCTKSTTLAQVFMKEKSNLRLTPGMTADVHILPSTNDVRSSDMECTICEYIVKEVDKVLDSNSTAQEAEAVLRKVCDLLPASIKQQCDDIIKIYAPAIAILIVEDVLQPEEVCQWLELCKKTTQVKPVENRSRTKPDTRLLFKPHLLGTKECERGPSFWCASVENMKKCDMESYCKTQVRNDGL